MARIRTVKPDFFRHELLQDLEVKHVGKHPMLVFAGLWGHCDKEGRFLWRPKQLKLDILPFLAFDMTETLSILEGVSQIVRYSVDGVDYGWIPTFTDHQAIGGKEAQAAAKYPDPPSEVMGKYRGRNGEVTGTAGREGEGRELGKEGNHAESSAPVDKNRKVNGVAWWKSEAGIKAKGDSLEMRPEPGESWSAYKDRIFNRLNAKKAAA